VGPFLEAVDQDSILSSNDCISLHILQVKRTSSFRV
jgi:hypothetical protein